MGQFAEALTRIIEVFHKMEAMSLEGNQLILFPFVFFFFLSLKSESLEEDRIHWRQNSETLFRTIQCSEEDKVRFHHFHL